MRDEFIAACGDRRWVEVSDLEWDSNRPPDVTIERKVVAKGEGNLVSSFVRHDVETFERGGLFAAPSTEIRTIHRPVLDLDIPHRLVPSTKEGHSHLYLDIDVEEGLYRDFLEAGVRAGIFQKGFVSQLDRLGATFARPPWLKKGAG